MKKLTQIRKKFEQERAQIIAEMEKDEVELGELRAMYEGQLRLIRSVTGHAKNQGAILNDTQGSQSQSVLESASHESLRNERIAKQVNRSRFMGLGTNPPKLTSESTHSLLNTYWSTFETKNSDYMKDEQIPPQIYTLIEEYRKKARTAKPGNDLAMMIDEFFGEVNEILKDSQLREIARIRNENNVTVTKLKRVIETLKMPARSQTACEMQAKSKGKGSLFIDNEAAIERRELITDLETTKKGSAAAKWRAIPQHIIFFC